MLFILIPDTILVDEPAPDKTSFGVIENGGLNVISPLPPAGTIQTPV